MTSIPASMSAWATTFAPRSCPSRPGFAMSIRIVLAINVASLTVSILNAASIRRVVPVNRLMDARNLAAPAFQAACVFDHHFARLFQGIKVGGADGDTHPLRAGCADFLVELDVAHAIVFHRIERYLFFHFHDYIFLMLNKSLHPSQLRMYFLATALAVAYKASFLPGPIANSAASRS